MLCQVGTIREIHHRLIQEGYRVSECALRKWVKEGVLPAVYAGNKALVAYDRVLEILVGAPNAAQLTPVTT